MGQEICHPRLQISVHVTSSSVEDKLLKPSASNQEQADFSVHSLSWIT